MVAISHNDMKFLDHNKSLLHFFIGAVMLSPSPRAYVCNDGDSLEVTCNTTDAPK